MRLAILAVLLLISSFGYSQQQDIDWSKAYSTTTKGADDDGEATRPGWNNPHNPHYNPDTNVPLDNGVVYLVIGAIVYGLFKARQRKREEAYEWID